MRKVLISVDETKGSLATMSVFKNMVKPPEEIILLHVQKPGGKSLMYDMLGEAEMSTLLEMMEGTEKKELMDKKAQKILAYFSKELEKMGLVNVRTIVRAGIPVNEILKVIKEESIDLVLLGCNGKSKLNKLITGCVTRDVEKISSVPILVAKVDGCDKACEENFFYKEATAAYASK